MRKVQILVGLGVMLSAGLAHSGFGGGTLTVMHAPVVAAQPVPAMSDIMMITLSLLLSALAYRVIKNGGGSTLKGFLIAGIALTISGLSGGKLIENAYAIGMTTNLSDANPVVLNVGVGMDIRTMNNNTGMDRVLNFSVVPNDMLETCDITGGTCVDGGALNDMAQCSIETTCTGPV